MLVGMLIERFVPKRTVGGVGGVVAARARRESGGRGAGIGIVISVLGKMCFWFAVLRCQNDTKRAPALAATSHSWIALAACRV